MSEEELKEEVLEHIYDEWRDSGLDEQEISETFDHIIAIGDYSNIPTDEGEFAKFVDDIAELVINEYYEANEL